MKREINPWGLASLALALVGFVLIWAATNWMVAIGIFAMLVANNMAHSIRLTELEGTQ